ncbi:Flp pilus assembly protein CpaB [Bradyrhizobium sp. WD16]|uniref:Flp pilus assembly protein CpaB n=1 Tax=Bradyrhizobium sp. WD16 TaxID=1521768 RepID=UPI0020A2DF1B|nr:Flp pilus assembly protein CpaB [Bradyrhizobium sp. WD16]UTD27447.1 Flp pilus assembly protein CpaB [Bradyrhizobium sp. WD16]
MNTAKIVVLAISVAAGGLAIYLVSGSETKQVVQAPTAQIETVDVLVAKSDIPLGQTVTPADLQWQTWPAANSSDNFIRRNQRPDAIAQYGGSIARSPFLAGEPIRDMKLVKGPTSGIMAALLPTGMRAVSTEISAETGAGGFILPNDHVDVILSRRDAGNNRPGADQVVSEIILSNVRVMAIDQTIEEKNGQKVVVGKTATLELRPEQAEVLAKARQTGTLMLALRSIVDVNAPAAADDRRASNNINVVRFGVPTSATVQR